MKSSHLLPSLISAILLSAWLVPAQTPDAAERKKLDGVWVGGVKQPGGRGKSGQGLMVNITELVIKDGKITAKSDRGGRGLGEGTYTLNLNANPRNLDAIGTGGPTQGKNYLGIYRLNGDTLEWCAANPGIARPKDFFTTPQVQFHMVLTRKKG